MPIDLHLQEIEDDAARDGVKVFKTQMEIVILTLLDEDRAIALGQIEEARTASLDHAAAFASPALTAAEGAKAERIARAMLTDTFGRIRTVIEAPDDDRDIGLH